MFSVTVIIPVYNAAAFVKKAVESAIGLPEVGEVLLIDDGSPDNAIGICLRLCEQYEKVRCFQHPNGMNRGAGASRNLGIENASCEYIAFLDADDWYLPHRFEKDKLVFAQHPNADACYSCTVIEENQNDSQKNRYGVQYDPKTKGEIVERPGDLYAWKLLNKAVLFNTNSITINKNFLVQDKCFDTRLRLHQDTELWNRLMRRGVFYAAEWQFPVAVIRRHEHNRIPHRSPASILRMLAILMENIGYEKLQPFEKQYLFEQFLRNESREYKNAWARRFNFYFQKYANILKQDLFLRSKMLQYAID